MSKLFVITDCKFELPDDFNGSCGDALMLLAEYRLQRENESKIIALDDNISWEERKILLEEYKNKCILTYGFKEDNNYV